MQPKSNPPNLYTVLSPSLLPLYELNKSIVVIIDVLRATSTIATALHHGAREIIPVDSVEACIRISKQMDAISAGERDGQVAEGLQYGNTPLQYTPEFIKGKTLVLTTTNGTRLLHQAIAANALEIITGSFCNLSKVCDYIINQNKPVVLCCAAWRNKVNLEDTLLAGAVVSRVRHKFTIACDATAIAEAIYSRAGKDLFGFMKNNHANHYHRLMRFGLEEDIRYCLTEDSAPVLPIYKEGRLISI